ncbi:MAG: hypothetical protein HY941_12505 [Gammaproteobacteria bacterium]|nr:hypothetical protein [Gammaproteobacteria bacterium]
MHSLLKLVLVATVSVLALIPRDAVQAADLETQTNREGSVTVKVTPRNISPQAKRWDFEIVFDTHVAALDQDMRRAAVLVDGSGTAQPPLAWEGDPPGGHHRKGILHFQPLPGSAEFLELRISGIGGVDERVFRWRMGE